jgi:long-chain acyl-CoA synthetase
MIVETATTTTPAAGDRFAVPSLCRLFQDTAGSAPAAIALRAFDGSAAITWGEYSQQVRRVAAGLAQLGVRSGDAVALMLVNRPEFHICDAGAMHLGAASFSIYNTLAADTVRHLLQNAGARVVICERRFLATIQAARRDTPVEHVVCIDGPVDGGIALEGLEALGDPSFDFEAAWRAVTPDQLLTLIYTSGTTGPPKGVELTHANMLAQLRMTAGVLPLSAGDVAPSVLPMAHVAERWGSHYRAMAHGMEVTCVADARLLPEVLKSLRPTVWGSVPRIWEKLYAGVQAALAAETDGDRRAAVQKAVDLGLSVVRAEQAAMGGDGPGPDASLLSELSHADELILSSLRAGLGLDRVRWSVVGAAPTPLHILEFFAAIGVPLRELWGMSELSTVAAVNPAERIRFGTVGPPLPGVELRIADDSEVLVRADTVMRGYRVSPRRRPRQSTAMTGCTPAISARSTTRVICGSSTARRS